MRAVFALAIVLLSIAPAWAAVLGTWTGRSNHVQTITYRWVWECEYDVGGKRVWILSERFCPATVRLY